MSAWSHANARCLKYIAGIDIVTHGAEILKSGGPYIIACQHQSDLETVTFFRYCTYAFVYKKELNSIPFFGNFMQKSGMLSVDREQGTTALRNLLKNGKKAIENRGGIIIFPEGKRMPVGQVGKINAGLWALYKTLKIPVIPVTLSTGPYWRPKQFLKYPGTATIIFHTPFELGLDRDVFEERLKQIYLKRLINEKTYP
jgi:1-acyl-sn-glycerol-3-phosphate acyltransferase